MLSSETRLWQAVVVQALLDIAGTGTTAFREAGGEEKVKADAVSWADTANREFLDVCSLAGMDCQAVARVAKAVSTPGDHSATVSRLVAYRASLLP